MPHLVHSRGGEVGGGNNEPTPHAPDARARSVQPITPRLICMATVARSGTNYLCSVLSRISDIDVRHEIFHKTVCQKLHERELTELSRRSGKAFPPDCRNAVAVSAVRQQPSLVMDCLTDLMAPEKRLLFFKVFRLQLSVRQVRDAFIRRPDTIVIVLRRRPIDTFVSLRKALYLQNWHNRDTTDFKISIDANDFIGWWGRTSAWFRQVEAACWAMNKPFHRLTYESDVDVPAEKIIDHFRGILARHDVTGLTVSDDEGPSEIKRQDRNKEISSRVANWSEFRQRLSDKGFLEKAFSPFPYYEPTAWDRLCHRLGA